MLTPQQDLEQEIERLVRELGQIVRSADPEKQDDLKEFASTLVDQEFVLAGGSTRLPSRQATLRFLTRSASKRSPLLGTVAP